MSAYFLSLLSFSYLCLAGMLSLFFFLMIRRPPRSTLERSSAASDVYKRQGLAPVIIEQMMEAIRRLSDHLTVLLVEQNFTMASQLGDRYYIIDDGKNGHHGLMADLVQDKALIQRFLGVA